MKIQSQDILENYNISEISNYYGGLELIKHTNGKKYWGIEDYTGTEYEEISQLLFDSIIDEKFKK